MQTFLSAPVRLLMAVLLVAPLPLRAAPAKTHVVSLGSMRKVPYTLPGSSAAANSAAPAADAITMKVRPLLVDGRQKEWTTGEAHDVTDRSFTIRRAMRLNDQLPGESATRWSWQPGPWLLVDRTTGHIAALHLPDFDNMVSEAVWFRDYAAYCGVAQTAKGGLFAVVAQLGARRPVIQKQLGPWPQPASAGPACQPSEWQRAPLRATLHPTGGDAITFEVLGSASILEEGDPADEN